MGVMTEDTYLVEISQPIGMMFTWAAHVNDGVPVGTGSQPTRDLAVAMAKAACRRHASIVAAPAPEVLTYTPKELLK